MDDARSPVMPPAPPQVSCGWELAAPGWPQHRWARTLAYGLALVVAAALSFAGMTLAFGVPVFLPVAVGVAALQLYDVALWRSTRWSLGADGLLRISAGVFAPRGIRRLVPNGVDAFTFPGLTLETALALVQACQQGTPPPQLEARGTPRTLAGPWVAGLVWYAAGEAYLGAHRFQLAQQQARCAATTAALQAAFDEVAPEIEDRLGRRIRLDLDEVLSAEGNLITGKTHGWWVQVRARPIAPPWSPAPDQALCEVSLACRRRGGWPFAPDPVRVYFRGKTCDALLLGALLPRLERAGVPYEVHGEETR